MAPLAELERRDFLERFREGPQPMPSASWTHSFRGSAALNGDRQRGVWNNLRGMGPLAAPGTPGGAHKRPGDAPEQATQGNGASRVTRHRARL